MIPEAKIKRALSAVHKRKIFVTGGTGFFGKSLLDFLLLKNTETVLDVVVLSRDPDAFLSRYPQYKNQKWLRFQKGDLLNLKSDTEKFDDIIHFAATVEPKLIQQDPQACYDILVEGTKRVMEFAKATQAKRMLFTSSGAVYGKNSSNSVYVEGKREAEKIGREYASQIGIDFKVARCFAFVGPQQDNQGSFAIGQFIRKALLNEKIEILGDGTPLRSYLYSEDLIVWFLNILNGPQNCIYDVGSDKPISIKDLAYTVRDTLSSKSEIYIAKTAQHGALPESYLPNISQAKSELDLDVWTSIVDAIMKTAAGYRKSLDPKIHIQ